MKKLTESSVTYENAPLDFLKERPAIRIFEVGGEKYIVNLNSHLRMFFLPFFPPKYKIYRISSETLSLLEEKYGRMPFDVYIKRQAKSQKMTLGVLIGIGGFSTGVSRVTEPLLKNIIAPRLFISILLGITLLALLIYFLLFYIHQGKIIPFDFLEIHIAKFEFENKKRMIAVAFSLVLMLMFIIFSVVLTISTRSVVGCLVIMLLLLLPLMLGNGIWRVNKFSMTIFGKEDN